jgi:hypothetical protein
MTRPTRMIVLSVALLPLACATAHRKATPAASSAQTPLPRSSIAAVLQHRGELQLSDEQVRRLQDLDDQLERQNAALRQEADKRQTQGQPSGGAFRGAMGGRSGMGGRSIGGSRSPPSNANGPKSIEERIDDNDTSAYLEAEKVLTESQTPQAWEIASRFREESWDWRHATRNHSGE